MTGADKAIWAWKNRGIFMKIARKHKVSRSLVSDALWERAWGPKAMRVHRSIDKAIFNKTAEDA